MTEFYSKKSSKKIKKFGLKISVKFICRTNIKIDNTIKYKKNYDQINYLIGITKNILNLGIFYIMSV